MADNAFIGIIKELLGMNAPAGTPGAYSPPAATGPGAGVIAPPTGSAAVTGAASTGILRTRQAYTQHVIDAQSNGDTPLDYNAFLKSQQPLPPVQ